MSVHLFLQFAKIYTFVHCFAYYLEDSFYSYTAVTLLRIMLYSDDWLRLTSTFHDRFLNFFKTNCLKTNFEHFPVPAPGLSPCQILTDTIRASRVTVAPAEATDTPCLFVPDADETNSRKNEFYNRINVTKSPNKGGHQPNKLFRYLPSAFPTIFSVQRRFRPALGLSVSVMWPAKRVMTPTCASPQKTGTYFTHCFCPVIYPRRKIRPEQGPG